MEPLTLITTAISLATPYLVKTGESFAEGIGEDIWKLIKKPFVKHNEDSNNFDLNNPDEKERLINLLIEEVNKNKSFKDELEDAILLGQKNISANIAQQIKNIGEIEKQINIQQNNGNIKM
jgi:hypothetical protein